MIILGPLVERYNKLYNSSLDVFVETCKEKGEPCSIARVDPTVVNEDVPILTSYTNVIIVRDNDKHDYKGIFRLSDLKVAGMKVFAALNGSDLELLLEDVDIDEINSTMRLDLIFETFDYYINLCSTVVTYSSLVYDYNSDSEFKDSLYTKLYYKLVNKDL